MKISFTKNQWQRISELLGGGGMLALGSIAIPALFDNFNLWMITLGLVVAILLIYLSIFSARRY